MEQTVEINRFNGNYWEVINPFSQSKRITNKIGADFSVNNHFLNAPKGIIDLFIYFTPQFPVKVKTDKYTTLLDSFSAFGGFLSLIQASLGTIGSFFLYKQFIMKLTKDNTVSKIKSSRNLIYRYIMEFIKII